MKRELTERLAHLPPEKRAALLARVRSATARSTGESALRRVSRTRHLPASSGQERLWFLGQLEPESATYNLPFLLRAQGLVDSDAVRQAVGEVARRHEVLRTRYGSVEGHLLVTAERGAGVALGHVDLTGLVLRDRDAHAHVLAERESQRPFDLAHGPLMRNHRLCVGSVDCFLLFVIHHVVCDRWSREPLIGDLINISGAFGEGVPSPLGDLSIQYADYAAWQRESLRGGTLDQQMDYWRKQLAGAPPLSELPADRPRPAMQTYNGAWHWHEHDGSLLASLNALCRQEGVTLFMLLLASFQTLLMRYSGQEDLCVGAAVSARKRRELEDLVGFFLNTLVLRAHADLDPTFREFLQRVRRSTVEAYDHQDLPFERMVEELQVQRSLSHPPLFQVCVSFLNVPPAPALKLLGASLSMVELQQSAKFDLSLYAWETPAGLRSIWEYNRDLFDSSTIQRVANSWDVLLHAITEDPDQQIGSLAMLDAAEESQIVVEWNDTGILYPADKNLPALFTDQVGRTPDAVALVFEDVHLTYAALNRRVTTLADRLRGLGIGPGVIVGVYAERSVEMVLALYGVLRAGGTYVPLEPSHPAERLAFMRDDAGAFIVLTHRPVAEIVPRDAVILQLDEDWEVRDSGDQDLAQSRAEDSAYLIYTSGSTGSPKGVLNHHEGIRNRLQWMQAAYALDASDCVLQKTPFGFDVSVWEFFWPLMEGAKLVVANPEGHREPSYLVKVVQEEQVTTMHFVPSMLQAFVDEPGLAGCGALRRVVCSGEALPMDLQRRFRSRHAAALENLYGPTEAAVDVTYWSCRDTERAVVPIGQPIANIHTHVVGPQSEPVGLGIRGELYIAGVGLAHGYVGRPALTAERFVTSSDGVGARSYRTGDASSRWPEGAIEYVGRLDFQVKVRGLRIELGEIARALAEHPRVSETVVVARDQGGGERRLIAYLVVDPMYSPVFRGRQRYKLRNNMAIVVQNQPEADFLYEEIFANRSYLKHGISIRNGDCIFDVGANIGMFALFAQQVAPQSRVYAFEPVPPIVESLRLNAELYASNVKVFGFGLSDKDEVVPFSFYPHDTVISGRYADARADAEVVRSYLQDVAVRDGQVEILTRQQLDELLAERLVTERYACRLRPFSDVIREENLARVDLLKIDVERAEEDVLAGIREEDWAKIRQVVIEVHDVAGGLPRIVQLLEKHGFGVAVEHEDVLQGTPIANLYARRPDAGVPTDAPKANPLAEVSLPELEDSVVSVSGLRAFLQGKLPEYMVPSAFVFLDKLPLTPNGKVDRKALPAPEARPGIGKDYVAPRSDAETALAKIWSEVLKIDKVGVHDNFFELGGDSILSIQVVSRARQAGLGLTPKLMFEHQTVAELASAAGSATVVHADQGIVAGTVPLTPIQHWFFEQKLVDAHHWNQALTLEVRGGLDTVALARAMAGVVRHHDALRMRYVRKDGRWVQENASEEPGELFRSVKLEHAGSDDARRAIAEESDKTQASLSLSAGPLVRAVYFDSGEEETGRLLLVIHHLVVDGVTWRILLEDLETAYEQALHGGRVELPAKTTSFQEWSKRLSALAQGSAQLKGELEYWRSLRWDAVRSLPADNREGENTEAGARQVEACFDREETARLLQEVPHAYRTEANDVLLTAVGRALAEWSGGQAVAVDVEGHGREEIIEGVDVARTAGWFTSIFPVVLEVGGDFGPPGSMLKRVKEELRGIPRKGIGYGLLRYLSGDQKITAELGAKPDPEVSFNYLGQLDQGLRPGNRFALTSESPGAMHSGRAERRHLLDVLCRVMDGELKVTWTYSEARFKRSTVEKLAARAIEILRELITHCTSEQAGGYTPSDFRLAGLNQEQLDRLYAVDPKIADIYPLTPMQQGLVFHSLMDKASGVYVEQLHCGIRGLEIEAFRRAWADIVEAVPQFRVWLLTEEVDRPLQVVRQEVALPLEIEDWRGCEPPAQRAKLAAYLEEDRRRGFDFLKAPLMRLRLFRGAEDAYWLVWTHHHVLLDGWSVSAVLGQVFDAYERHRAGSEKRVDVGGVYRDYVEWLVEQPTEKAEHFWRGLLAGFGGATEIGLETPRSDRRRTASGGERAEQRALLSQELTERIVKFARKERVTMAAVVQAAWGALLTRYSGNPDVVFGTTGSGRNAPVAGIENMVGLLINTLPVRVRWTADRRATEIVQSLHAEQVQAREYEHSSLSDVQRWGGAAKGQALFDSLLVFENYPIAETMQRQRWSVDITDVGFVERTSYLLTLLAIPGRELELQARYRVDRYERTAVTRMLGHLVEILSGLAKEPNARLHELHMLSAGEEAQVVREWNDTGADYPADQCIPELFHEQAERTPDAVAVVFEDEQLTYAALNGRADELSYELGQLGVGPDVLVGICTERCTEMVIGLLGILKAGGGYVPIETDYPKQRLVRLLDDISVTVLLTHQATRRALEDLRLALPSLDDDRASANAHTVACRAENLAYINFTSGSTGEPKAIGVQHQSVNRLVFEANYATFTPDDVFMQYAPLAFDATTLEVWAPLLNGGRLAVMSPGLAMPADLAEFIEATQVTTAWLTSGLFAQLVDSADLHRLRGVRQLLTGGDVVSPTHVAQLLACVPSCSVINGYGPTENTTFSSCYPMSTCNTTQGGPIPIGWPITNSVAHVLGEDGQITAAGGPGVLFAGGAGVARGYLNRLQLTAARFAPEREMAADGGRSYDTGDIVARRRDGRIDFRGRRDHQVKLRGFRIELGEVESALAKYSGIRDCVLLIREDQPGNRRLVAYVTVGPGAPPTVTELRAHLSSRLPDYMVPAVFVFLERLPLTPNGKVDRTALPAPEGRPELEGEYVAPRNETEEKLAKIWSEVLRLEKVGVNDNFFELGGDSILSIQIVSRARRAGLGLTPKLIFEHQTVAALAEVAQRNKVPETTAEQGLVVGEVPLTPIQRSFFDEERIAPEHFNQALVLVAPRMDGAALCGAVGALMWHHDALRSRYSRTHTGWRQHIVREESSTLVTAVDLSNLPRGARERSRLRLADEVQATLHLETGPLVRFAQFVASDEARCRLLVAIHHLVVDGVSWRILLGDLQTAYGQKQAGTPVSLPVKTTSFRRWSRELGRWAQTEPARQEAGFWHSLLAGTNAELPQDHEGGVNTVDSGEIVTMGLTREETESLLREVPLAYHTQINDALLTTLALALGAWTGRRRVLFDLEGHGREDQLLAGTDLSRTVGWFTSLYPVALEVDGNAGPGENLKSVKEQLRAIPRGGVGYGALRFLCGDELLVQRMRELPRAQVVFNYLGQLDQALEAGSALSRSEESTGSVCNPREKRDHLLEISGSVTGEKLSFNVMFSRAIHRRETIERFVEIWGNELRGLIAHCVSGDAGGYTPSDFADAALSQEELDHLIMSVEPEEKDG